MHIIPMQAIVSVQKTGDYPLLDIQTLLMLLLQKNQSFIIWSRIMVCLLVIGIKILVISMIKPVLIPPLTFCSPVFMGLGHFITAVRVEVIGPLLRALAPHTLTT